MEFKKLAGKKYNRLLLLKCISINPIKYKCKCECGNIKELRIYDIVKEKIKSCGCLNKEKRKTSKLIHGESHSPTYNTWKNLRSRCNNIKNNSYKDYGARGIKVCDRWKSFNLFLLDMGKKPSSKFQIERLDNNKGYCKENCTWATVYTQQRNRRSTHLITYYQKTQCLTDWALELNLPKAVLSARINKLKWSIEKSFNTPLLRQNKTYNKELNMDAS